MLRVLVVINGLEEVGASCCSSSPEDDLLYQKYFHTGANKNFLKTKVRD